MLTRLWQVSLGNSNLLILGCLGCYASIKLATSEIVSSRAARLLETTCGAPEGAQGVKKVACQSRRVSFTCSLAVDLLSRERLVDRSASYFLPRVPSSHSRRRRHRSLHRKPQAPQIRWAAVVAILQASARPVNLAGPEAVSERWQRQREGLDGTPVPFLEPEPEGAIVV
jgi:hypothetical protein